MKRNSTVVLRQETTLSPDALIEALSGSIITQPDGVVVYLNAEGKPHRTAGPAIVYPDGDQRWFLNGEEVSEETFNQRIADGGYSDT